MTNSLVGTGFSIGLDTLTGLQFEPDKPYRACFICGAIYQTNLDRYPNSLLDIITSKQRRDDWAKRHSKQHTTKEHHQFKGRMTPEAANTLAAYGIIDVVQLATDEESSAAYGEAPRKPSDDAEGG